MHWPAEALWEAIAPQLPGFSVEILPSVDSTNSELMRRARSGHADPILLLAEQQTAGRGRLGRQWLSQPGDSLMFSLGLPLAPADWSGLSLAVGLSVAESLQPALPAHGSQPRLGLKWPNDLWLSGPGGDYKLGGILIETASFAGAQPQHAAPSTTGPTPRYVVIGIGLNVRPPADSAALSVPAASLQMLDPALDAPGALQCIVPPLLASVQAFVRSGFAPLQTRFAARDVLRGRSVVLSNGDSGTACGVASDGALLVENAQGLQQHITSADVSVRPAGASH